jgi:hypothetical protein
MGIELPPDKPVDRTRAGVLPVAIPMLGWLLRLPEGNEVTGARVDLDRGVVELLIEGADMPPRLADGAALPVDIICQMDTRLSGVSGRYERQTRAHFAHAPKREWVQMPWSIEP